MQFVEAVTRRFFTGAAVLLLTVSAPLAQVPDERHALFAAAQVWHPVSVGSMNLRSGEPGPGAFAPNETVHCAYLGDDLAGRSPKFRCRIPPEDDVKVKFGAANGEVYGEVAATRLLWALGFGADRMYPVHVICRGCPDTIGAPHADGARRIEAATIERKAGITARDTDAHGWSWADLDLVDEHAGGAPRAQRDALKLLAVFLQHTDTKREQQRVICLDAPPIAGRPCARPFLLLNDVGLTFGRATLLNSNTVSGMNHREWASTPIWRYSTTCIGNLPRSVTGTIRDPIISEAGRQFLATLLAQLSDRQLHDLFDVARAARRDQSANASPQGATIDQWVETFKQKRAAIVNRRCADDWSSVASVLFSTTPNLWLQSRASSGLTAAMHLVSLCGYTPIYVALAVLLAFTVNIRAGASLLLLLVLTDVVTSATKSVVSYPRPDAVDTRIKMLGPVPDASDHSNPTVAFVGYLPARARDVVGRMATLSPAGELEAIGDYGFPSGHVSVALAFLAGLVFLFGWRGAWMAALLWVPVMAVSRMYLGRHFLGDAVGGVAVGLVATMVVVRGLNLQRLRAAPDRRVLGKTIALAAACAALAFAAAIPPVYEAGRLAGAAVALVLVTGVAPASYDEASWIVRSGRLGLTLACWVAVWWVTAAAVRAYGGDPTPAHAFLIGAMRMTALLAAPVLIERALRGRASTPLPDGLRIGIERPASRDRRH